MADTAEPPADEPDTPIEDISFPDIVAAVEHLVLRTRHHNKESAELERERQGVLYLLDQLPNLHGVVLPDGAAVRKRWVVSQWKIFPEKLREAMADAPTYLKEVVDAAKLRADYPTIWEQLAKVKRRHTVAVYLPESRVPKGGESEGSSEAGPSQERG